MEFDLPLQTLQDILNGLIAALPNMVLALATFLFFYFAAGLVRWVARRAVAGAELEPSAQLIIGRLTRALVILLGVLVAALVLFPSFDAGQLIELLGIAGVAVGFAFRDILQNFLAGILLLLTQPFRIGDQIIVSEYEGTVEDIQTRATLIRMYDGRRVVIPNTDLFTQSVTVNTAHPIRRSEYDVGIGYGDDIQFASQLIVEALGSVAAVLPEPAPDVQVVEFAPSAVMLRARWWTDSTRSGVIAVESQVLTAIKDKLLSNGVDLPFPTRQILFHDQTEETDGDRRRQREGWPAAPVD